MKVPPVCGCVDRNVFMKSSNWSRVWKDTVDRLFFGFSLRYDPLLQNGKELCIFKNVISKASSFAYYHKVSLQNTTDGNNLLILFPFHTNAVFTYPFESPRIGQICKMIFLTNAAFIS